MGGVMWVQGYRMRWFLAKDPWRMKGIHAFRSMTIGSLYNAVLSGNLGEAVKKHHFARRNNIRLRTAMACWVGEKFIQGMMMACLGMLLLLLPAFRESLLKWPLLIPIAIAIACASVLTWSYRSPETLKVLFRLFPTAVGAKFLFRVFLEFRERLFGQWWRFWAVAFIVEGLCVGGITGRSC